MRSNLNIEPGGGDTRARNDHSHRQANQKNPQDATRSHGCKLASSAWECNGPVRRNRLQLGEPNSGS